jgi:vacuolar-type H+-ATPase subunit E/Vma4
MTEASKRAKRKYFSKVKRITVDFYPTEQELIDHLEKQPQKTTYIKNLIRQDTKKDG